MFEAKKATAMHITCPIRVSGTARAKGIYHQQFFIVFALPPPGRVVGRVRELPTKFSWLPPTTHSLEREVTDIQKFHLVFAEVSLRSFSRLSHCNTPLKKNVCQNCFKRTSQETVLDISEVKSQHQCTRARHTEEWLTFSFGNFDASRSRRTLRKLHQAKRNNGICKQNPSVLQAAS